MDNQKVDPDDLLYVCFRSYQSIGQHGNETDGGEYLEICTKDCIGDDKSPAIPFIRYDPNTHITQEMAIGVATIVKELEDMILFAMKGDFQPWQFAAHVMDRGGTGDIDDCKSFLRQAMESAKNG